MLPEKNVGSAGGAGTEESASSRASPRKAFPGARGGAEKAWRRHTRMGNTSAVCWCDWLPPTKGAEVLINYSSRHRQGHSRERGRGGGAARLKLATPQSFPRSLKRS